MKISALQERQLPVKEQSYTFRDTILYALGVGMGADPTDAGQLRFLYEKNLQILPTITCVLGHPGFWAGDPAYEINYVKLLHGGQSIEMLGPLPSSGNVSAKSRVLGVDDKGPEKGAIVYFEKMLSDADTGKEIARVRSVYVMRGDGGCGSYGEKAPPPAAIPTEAPEYIIDLPTVPQAALIYRLSGDYNPLHIDPEVAVKAGFPKPILHGLCTMGVACRGLVEMFCGFDATRLKGMTVRFTKPIYPGETIRLEAWKRDGKILFRARVPARDLIAMDGCEAIIAD